MRKSSVLRKLRNDQVVLSTSVSFTNSAKVTELVGMLGYDCIWIDTEHRPYDYDVVSTMIQGARCSDIDCLVRLRKESYASYFRFLEDGAAGIMVPHCLGRKEAEEVVHNAKYPPLGMRGIDGVGADADYGLADQKEYISHANKETFITIQIEDREAVDQIDTIASVKGIDLLFVGPGDLAKSFGVMGQFRHPLILSALEKIAAAAARNGIWWGIPVGNTEDAKQYVSMGARFLNIGSDRGVLANGFKSLIHPYKTMLK